MRRADGPSGESAMTEIPSGYRGGWRIVETSHWASDGLDILGPALLSVTGYVDRLRMHCLLAYVNCKPTTAGVSFAWEGAWEAWVKRKGPAHRRDEQRGERERYDEHAFLFGPDERCFGKVERDEWDFAISIAGGNASRPPSRVGFEVRGTRALWGRTQEAAIGAYRSWLKRKAGKR
jgi:hypothetical protein